MSDCKHQFCNADGKRVYTYCQRGCGARDPLDRLVLYVAHPLRPTPEEIAACGFQDDELGLASALDANIERAMRWLAWLRRTFPEVTFVAPWIAAVLAGEDDADPAQREGGLVDACAVIPLLHGVVMVGGRISSGMQREADVAREAYDLTALGNEPPPHRLLEQGTTFLGFCERHRLAEFAARHAREEAP